MQKLGVNHTTFGAGSAVTVGSMGKLSYQRIYRHVRTETIYERGNITASPTSQPSSSPTSHPSGQPSTHPSSQPTAIPTVQPSAQPISSPSHVPHSHPTSKPSRQPSSQPSRQPSRQPTTQPSELPSHQPSSQPSSQPTRQPTTLPSTQPSAQPSTQPSCPSSQPSDRPSSQPSHQPTAFPTSQPTGDPTGQPSSVPTRRPSTQPTGSPTTYPSNHPSAVPSGEPSSGPTSLPSGAPTTSVRRRLEEVTTDSFSDAMVSLDTEKYFFYPVNTSSAVTFPMLFAMIIVDNGKVKSIAWDNFCSWCDDRHCAPNTVSYDSQLLSNIGPNCFLSDDQCYHRQEAMSDDTNNPANVTITSNQLCELTVYIAWEGTDVNGINFNSAAYRFSRWTTDQIGNFTSSLEEKTIII